MYINGSYYTQNLLHFTLRRMYMESEVWRKKIDTPHQQQQKQLQKSICLLKMKYCIMILGRSMAAVVVGWLHLFIFLLYFSGYMVQILWVCRIYSREWAWIKKLIKIFMIEIFFVRMMSTWFLFNALSSLFNGDVESKKKWIYHLNYSYNEM